MVQLTDREKRIGLHLPVRVEGEDPSGGAFKEATRTLNLSGGGLCFESRHSPPIGSRLQLEIDLPPALRKHFGGHDVYEVTAMVCRVEHLESHEPNRVGARFLAGR